MASTTIEERPEPRVTLGDLLKRARLDAGYEQAELAERIGSSRSAVGAWERDKSQPDFGYVKRIAAECDAPWLFTEPFKNEVRTRNSWYGRSAGESAGQELADAAA